MGLTTNIAVDLSEIQKLEQADQEKLHLLIIDFFAAAFAGYQQNREFNKVLEEIITQQGGVEESYILFQEKKYPARLAAFMNSAYGHGAELDDGHKKAAGHGGVHLIPAVFAIADKMENSNDDVLIALATGYEAYVRISSAAQPGLVQRGFHSTGVAGTLACAAACARLFHLDSQGIEDAISIATLLSGGLLSYGDSRPSIKPINPAKAAENGSFAAMLAAKGMQGPKEALEGRNGWFHAFADNIDSRYLNGKDHLLLHECYLKCYPSCRHTHCGIDAAVLLHKKIKVEEIESINVFIYPNAIDLAGIRVPKNQDETKFSIYYTVACALLNGKYGIEDMNPPRLDTEVTELIRKIKIVSDSSLENQSKGIRGARIQLTLHNGRKAEETVLFPKGDPENPLTKNDIISKLKVCSMKQVDDRAVTRLVDSISSIVGRDIFKNPMCLIRG